MSETKTESKTLTTLRRHSWLIAGAVIVATLVVQAPVAQATIGALDPQGCFMDTGGSAGCLDIVDGLAGANSVAVSPDGKSVYVASAGDHAIVHFERNTTTGALTHQGCIMDTGGTAGCARTENGLGGAWGVAVSPDGKSVYVASFSDKAIVRFERDTTTGALNPQGCFMDTGGTAGCLDTADGLAGAFSVAVSPDDMSVYVASSNDDAIVRFERDTATGALTHRDCVMDTGGTAGCAQTKNGLDGARGVAVSPDDKSVYVASYYDDAIVRFERDTATGALTHRDCVMDTGGTAGCAQTKNGLDGAFSVAVSPDDKSVYVASNNDDAIVRFERDTTTGALTHRDCVMDTGGTAGCVDTADGLDGAIAVAVSPDDKSVYVASLYDDDAIVRFDRDTATGALDPHGCVMDTGGTAGCLVTADGLDGARGVAVSPDDKSVYVTSYVDKAIVRFNREVLLAPENTAPPVITGTPHVGQQLSCSQGEWDNEPDPDGYSYKWQRDGADIILATDRTYTLVDDDASTEITCTETASNDAGEDSATSEPVSPVALPPPTPPTPSTPSPPSLPTTPPTPSPPSPPTTPPTLPLIAPQPEPLGSEAYKTACNITITSPKIKIKKQSVQIATTAKSAYDKITGGKARRLFTHGAEGYIKWGKVDGKAVVCKKLKMAVLQKRGNRYYIPGTKTRVSSKYLTPKYFPTKGTSLIKKKKDGKLRQKSVKSKKKTTFSFKDFNRKSKYGRKALNKLKKQSYSGTFAVIYSAEIDGKTVVKTILLKAKKKKK